MKWSHFYILIALLSCSSASFAQGDPLFPLKMSVPGRFTDFTVDNLGNIFLLDPRGQLKKISPAGDSIAVYNDVTHFGKVSYIDVTNPLKVLLYYRDFGTVAILDRLLNKQADIDLRKQNLFQVKAIGQSYDNNIWAFDELDSKLKRIDENGRTVDQSTDFRLLFDTIPAPEFIVDQNKQVYLYDDTKGVYIFDYYGAFKNRIRFTGWTDFAVIGNILLGRDANTLYRYEPGTLKLDQYPIPPLMKNARKLKITPGLIYVLHDDRLDIYSYRPD